MRIAGIIMAGSLAFLTAGAGRTQVTERIVAKVNNEIITKTEWEDMVQYSLVEKKDPLKASEKGKFADQVLDRMISDRLIVQAAKAEGLKVTDTDADVLAQVDHDMEAVRSRFASDKEFRAQLRKEGMTIEDLRERYIEQWKDRLLYLKILNKKRHDFESLVDVSEGEIGKYCEENRNREEWSTAAQVKARHIQFNVPADLKGGARATAMEEARKKAAAARAAIKRGESFEDVAASFSEDATTKGIGGDLGTFSKGTYTEAIEKAAFSMKPGSVSGLVESPAGIHLIKVEQAFKPRLKALDEMVSVAPPPQSGPVAPTQMTMRESISLLIKNEKVSEKMQSWISALRERAVIQRFEDNPPRT